ncbi:uncharacterized protein LOC125236041 [Leguminivora glycinivorella]|uniref:uncharacterized protein LOC125236041 n=1 Tax=Leguminivora glycinivorella TaxID=1035111 RepID=UPI0020105D67|nr:uncharacterized protein LOC125236041 [Leguminivora glycinivorella]
MTDVYECKAILTTDSADVTEDADELPAVQLTPTPQEPKKIPVPVQKRRMINPPELAETSAHMKTALYTLNDALTAKNRVEKVADDDCDLYGKLLAKTLRQFNEIDRLEIRHEIDGLI